MLYGGANHPGIGKSRNMPCMIRLDDAGSPSMPSASRSPIGLVKKKGRPYRRWTRSELSQRYFGLFTGLPASREGQLTSRRFWATKLEPKIFPAGGEHR